MTAPVPAARPRPPLWHRSDVAVLPLLVVLGALLAVWGVLLVPAGPRVAGHVLSLGAAVGVVGNVLLARLALRASAPFGGVALLLGWLVVAVVASAHRANGSVVLPGSGDLAVPALVFLIGGLVAGLVAAFVRTPR